MALEHYSPTNHTPPLTSSSTAKDRLAKRTEDELRKSEEKFRTAFKTSPHVITLTNFEDGTYIEVNDAFTKLLGYSPKEIIQA